jgi:hypothetical protein
MGTNNPLQDFKMIKKIKGFAENNLVPFLLSLNLKS